MNPWVLLGWFFVVITGFTLVFVMLPLLLAVVANYAADILRYIAHYRTRNTPIRVGQEWRGADGGAFVCEVVSRPDGAMRLSLSKYDPFGSTHTPVVWSGPEGVFRSRIRHDHLYLARDVTDL